MKYPATYFDKKKSGGKKRKASEMSGTAPASSVSSQELAAIKSGLKTEFGAEVSPKVRTVSCKFDYMSSK